MIHITLLPSFLTSHFGKGWGSLGRYATQKSLVMRRSGYQPQKSQFVGLNPPRDTERTKFPISHRKISQTYLEICSLKRHLDLVSKLKSWPKPNTDLTIISSAATYPGNQSEFHIWKLQSPPTYIFIFTLKKFIWKPIWNTTFSSPFTKTVSQVKTSRLRLLEHKVPAHLSQEKGLWLNHLENNTLTPQMRLKIIKMPLPIFLLSFFLRINTKLEAWKQETEWSDSFYQISKFLSKQGWFCTVNSHLLVVRASSLKTM